ncbi:MAG TPA: methionine--tRNA ligase [Candidatus Saccharimonadia bacterium]|nr:methionine--tRNA ligase [Candidatus Saccharimonadia bacterium]
MKTYITSAIAYVNGPPHLGHALEFVIDDVLARYSKITGNETLLSIGTDEHGGKIAEKAESFGLSPKQLADKVSQEFIDLAKELNISYDRFIRTTDIDHQKRVQIVWNQIKDDIFKKEYQAWYCTGDEAFFSDEVVRNNNGICPEHNRPYEKISEENYFFKLSKYNDQIKNLIEKGEFRVIPSSKKNEILSLLSEGLEDISISRPKTKISWGIPVSDDDSQVIYVWFEALLNYITVLGYPDGKDFKQFWPADYQIVGKDILRFHAAIWPGILLALNIDTPKVLYVHGHIYVDNQKMSKSLGNSVEPKEIINKFGVDALRYYFLRHIPSYSDGDFSWDKFSDAYNNELGNELGNLVQRSSVMIQNYLGGKLSPNDVKSKPYDPEIAGLIEECRFDRALDLIWSKIKQSNQYIESEKPWVLYKNNDHKILSVTLNHQVESIRELAYLLVPFIPNTAEKILDIFGGEKLKPSETTLFPRVDLI